VPSVRPKPADRIAAVLIVLLIGWLSAVTYATPRAAHSDEGDILRVHERSICLAARPASQCPPTYVSPTRTWLQHRGTLLWLRATGVTLFSLRSICLVSGAVFLGAFYRLTRRLSGPGTALATLLLCATSPILNHYWTTGDEYAPYMAATAIALDRLLVWLESRRDADLPALLASTAFAVFWVYPSVFLFLPLALSFGLSASREARRFSVVCVALVAALTALYALNLDNIDADWRIERYTKWHGLVYVRVFEELGALLRGLNRPGRLLAALLALAVLGGLARYGALVARTGAGPAPGSAGVAAWFERRLARATLAVPPFMLLLSTVGPINDGHLLVSTLPVVYLALARAATADRRPWPWALPATFVGMVQAALAAA